MIKTLLFRLRLRVLYERSLMRYLMKNLDKYAPSSLRGKILKYGLLFIGKTSKTKSADVKMQEAN